MGDGMVIDGGHDEAEENGDESEEDDDHIFVDSDFEQKNSADAEINQDTVPIKTPNEGLETGKEVAEKVKLRVENGGNSHGRSERRRGGIKGPHKKGRMGGLEVKDDDFVKNDDDFVENETASQSIETVDSRELFDDSQSLSDESSIGKEERAMVSKFNRDKELQDRHFKIDKRFSSSNELKEATVNHGITYGRDIKFLKNDLKRVRAYRKGKNCS
ncbi:hypothetical protein M9H77_25587 [Catharanthus roseus]|uniref:Uncharacterized protein n=1 Tax=Catharanthus roseus TaxID=4058 RepID=A0ACC0A848_CATRO|nr:hypothetical protein M9H77_25587 [Catharanthus roseus]